VTDSDQERLQELLEVIENRLVEFIPVSVAKLRIKAPVYGIYLWYHDFSVDDFTPEFAIGRQEFFDAVFSGQYDSQIGGDADDCLMRPQQTASGPMPGFPLPKRLCDCVTAEINECYKIILKDLEQVDEEISLMPIRRMVESVGSRLQAIDWNNRLKVTENFYVFVSDYTGCYLGGPGGEDDENFGVDE
jgi:hypothetical protein